MGQKIPRVMNFYKRFSRNRLELSLLLLAGKEGGKQNRYGHPHLETIHRLQTYHTKIYRTDRSGAIIFFKRRDG